MAAVAEDSAPSWPIASLEAAHRGTVEEGSQSHLSINPIMSYIGCYRCFDDLHPDPRFQALLRKMRLPAVDRRSERVP
jgi:hypothetical protein